MPIFTSNPATGETLEKYEVMSSDQVMSIVAQSHDAFVEWRDFPVDQRCALMISLAKVLRENADRYARLMSLEMGKPIGEALAEIEKCAWLSEYYAENGACWLADEDVQADGLSHKVVYQPLGVVLSVMPWNYPFWQALRFGVPTLAAGNTSLLKHASNVTGCALAIEEAFKLAGFPENVFRTIIAGHQTVAEVIARHEVQGVSLTGSTEVGQRIAEVAGRHLKKVVLELGGSDPFIVLEDADVESAARGAVLGRTMCTGQSCIAAKRFIVVKEVADQFSQRFAELMEQLKVGDPLDPETNIGAMVNEQEVQTLQFQLDDAVEKGGKILCGGGRLEVTGCFFPPTVVSNTTPDMKIVKEEVFGPIAPIIVVNDAAEAVQVANGSEFGLGGSVWTRDLAKGEKLARQLECGTTFVNSIVKSDPRMPFGGVKMSGLGRELSHFGLREFVNVKGLSIYRAD